jgi:hypothetical protein
MPKLQLFPWLEKMSGVAVGNGEEMVQVAHEMVCQCLFSTVLDDVKDTWTSSFDSNV